MRVYVPSPLRSYVRDASEVEAIGRNVDEILRDIDRRFPGFRFRIVDEQDRLRQHIRIFVGEERAGLDSRVAATSEVHVICALSGG